MENISNQLDIKNLRDNVKRLVIKHGYKYVQFPEDHLGMKYVSFQNHLKSGKIGIDKLIIMSGLFNCGIYELFGEAEPVNHKAITTPEAFEQDKVFISVDDITPNHEKEQITDQERETNEKNRLPPGLDLDFLDKKI